MADPTLTPYKRISKNRLPTPTPQELVPFDMEDASVQIKQQLDLQISNLPAHVRSLVAKIASLTSKSGLSIDESCTLCDTSVEHLEALQRKFPVIKNILVKKQLEFKKDMMEIVATRARKGDDKMALSLLESHFPNEFGRRRRADTDGSDNLVEQAVKYIQKNGDSTTLVRQQKITVIESKSASKDRETVEQFLT